MIVLDEQLLGQGLEAAIAAWYPGKVCSIKSLRPNSVIKDDAIPTLLSQESEPTFVTINVGDFWDQVPLSDRYCVVCFSLTSEQVVDLPLLLQRLLRHTDFNTKAQRMGRVIRVSSEGLVTYYETAPRHSRKNNTRLI